MVSNKDLLVISSLRSNCREKLTKMSRDLHIPVSTLYERIKHNEGSIITKHTCLLDFAKLGFGVRVKLLIKINNEDRLKARDFLIKSYCINSVQKINNGYDYMVEGIFKEIKDFDEFNEKLDNDFNIEKKEIFYIVDDLKREEFLSDRGKTSVYSME